MIGGTAAAFMIFLLPGLLLMNAAIMKATVSYTSLSQVGRGSQGRGLGPELCYSMLFDVCTLCSARATVVIMCNS